MKVHRSVPSRDRGRAGEGPKGCFGSRRANRADGEGPIRYGGSAYRDGPVGAERGCTDGAGEGGVGEAEVGMGAGKGEGGGSFEANTGVGRVTGFPWRATNVGGRGHAVVEVEAVEGVAVGATGAGAKNHCSVTSESTEGTWRAGRAGARETRVEHP